MYQTHFSIYTLVPVRERQLLKTAAVLGSPSPSDAMNLPGILRVQHDVNSIVFHHEKIA